MYVCVFPSEYMHYIFIVAVIGVGSRCYRLYYIRNVVTDPAGDERRGGEAQVADAILQQHMTVHFQRRVALGQHHVRQNHVEDEGRNRYAILVNVVQVAKIHRHKAVVSCGRHVAVRRRRVVVVVKRQKSRGGVGKHCLGGGWRFADGAGTSSAINTCMCGQL